MRGDERRARATAAPTAPGRARDGPVALAARRLAIIDLEHGDQPIANEDGRVTVVQNGEIYNHARAARASSSARGHRFAHALRHRGASSTSTRSTAPGVRRAAARHVRGRAVGRPRSAGSCSRATASGSSRCSTRAGATARSPSPPSCKALRARARLLARARPRRARGLPRVQLDPGAAHDLPRGAQAAGPATCSRGTPTARRAERCARYARPRPAGGRSARRAASRRSPRSCATRLRDSVRAHLVADVPVGVLLSGGIDSSALTALAAQESREPVQTFSIGFEERSFDELDARARSSRAATAPTTTSSSCGPTPPSCCPSSPRPSTSRSATPRRCPTYLVSRLAAEHVKVVLSGEGGDELFGGYETYVADLLAAARRPRRAAALGPLVERLPSSARAACRSTTRLKRFARAAHLPPLERHHALEGDLLARARGAALLAGRARRRPARRPTAARYAETAGARAARAAAGPRPRHLPRRRPAGQDGPR